MTDEQKALTYYRTAAQQRSSHAPIPPFVPHVVRLSRAVRGDLFASATIAPPGDYECDTNRYGAVSVRATNGRMLGVKLDEFEALTWKSNPHYRPTP